MTPDVRETVEKLKDELCKDEDAPLDGLLAEVFFLIQAQADELAAAKAEARKWLSTTNENAKRGDLVACIRDLAQVAISERGNRETAEAELATLRAERANLAEAIGLPREAGDIASCDVVTHYAAGMHAALIAANDKLATLRAENAALRLEYERQTQTEDI